MAPPAPRACPFDGTQLDPATGFCLSGNGYPEGMLCPFVCPFCRRRLEWSGACYGCHGSEMPSERATWSFPGARYETHDEDGKPISDGQHRVKVAEPSHWACTPAENAAGFAEVQRLLGRVLGERSA
jgi:hypothetical protein